MVINTLVGLFCTFISKQPIIFSVGYKWSNCFPSASIRVDQINSDSIASQISIALVKRVKRHDCLTVDIGYIIHVELVGGSGDVYFPMVAAICSSVQLPFIYLNLSAILVSIGGFSCRSQVSYHIFILFTSLQEQGPQRWPNLSFLEHSEP